MKAVLFTHVPMKYFSPHSFSLISFLAIEQSNPCAKRMIDKAGQSEVLRFVGVGDIPCQERPLFSRGIVPTSRKLSGFPECDRNEANPPRRWQSKQRPLLEYLVSQFAIPAAIRASAVPWLYSADIPRQIYSLNSVPHGQLHLVA
jgi:hypothetical protein